MTINNDKQLLSLDFIGEIGDNLVSLGAAIAAAASAQRLDVLELALRQSRSVLIEAIKEFKALTPDLTGGAHE